MARLVVTPCASCGAPLEQDLELARETTCPFCGAVTPVARPVAEPSGPSIGLILGALFGGLTLLVGGALTIEELANRSNADRVTSLREHEADVVPVRAAALHDGGVWLACRYDRLCAVDREGKWLGSAPLPIAPHDAQPVARAGGTHGMAADRAGRVYVSQGNELIEYVAPAMTERRRLSVLPEGEHARCLAVAPADDALWMMTTGDDVVQLDAARALRSRWKQPVVKHDARHHGCSHMVIDAQGKVWIAPDGAPALYVLSAGGELLRRHAPGGGGRYTSFAVLDGDRAVLGYASWLVFLDPSFSELEGPRVRRDSTELCEVLRTAADTLMVVTSAGDLLRWENASKRW